MISFSRTNVPSDIDKRCPLSGVEPEPDCGTHNPHKFIALYVHWPFCTSKCPYCDFNSHVAADVDYKLWHKSLLRELEYFGERTSGRILQTVFFGGGTPSLMPAETVAVILQEASRHWKVRENLEVTLEANPSSSETKNFQELAGAGVNRISVGVQSFNDDSLIFLGRGHSAKSARSAVLEALECFERVSFDLIYALPGMDLKSWVSELNTALTLETGHLSLYQLTIEKGTRFYSAHQNGAFELPDDGLACELYKITNEMMGSAGYQPYEVSNYAKNGQECRHNIIYWKGGDYVGVGPGAHGRLTLNGTRVRTEQESAPEKWLSAVMSKGHGTRLEKPLTKSEQVDEFLLTGLRLMQGVDRNTFKKISGKDFEEFFPMNMIETLVSCGFIQLDAEGLRSTDTGRLRLNSLITSLLT